MTKKNTEQSHESAVQTAEPDIIEQTAPVAQAPAYEEVYIPPARPGEEEQLVLYFNGRSYVMDKGASYRLPKPVAAEYHRSVRAQHRAHARKADLQKKEKAINAHTDAVIAGKV